MSSKFFGKPNNSKPPAQQSVISLGKSKKSKATAEDNGDGNDIAPPAKKRRITNDTEDAVTNGDVSMVDASPSSTAVAAPDNVVDLAENDSTTENDIDGKKDKGQYPLWSQDGSHLPNNVC